VKVKKRGMCACTRRNISKKDAASSACQSTATTKDNCTSECVKHPSLIFVPGFPAVRGRTALCLSCMLAM